MMDTGSALMGIGIAHGENKAKEAAMQAIASPLLEASIDGAKGVLMNVTGGSDLGIFEVNEAAEIVMQAADSDANIIFGAVIDEDLEDTIQITVIATGFDGSSPRRALRAKEAPLKIEPREILEVPTFLRRAKSTEKAPLKGIRNTYSYIVRASYPVLFDLGIIEDREYPCPYGVIGVHEELCVS